MKPPFPGPKGSWLLGNLREFRRDMLAFFTRCAREFGDVVSFRLGPIRLVALSHPELIEQVLITKNRCFEKPDIMKNLVRPTLGNGLITSEGKFWLRQRRLIQPFFDRGHIEAYGTVIVDYVQRMLSEWQDGQTRDVHEEMMQLALAIVCKTLLGVDIGGEARDVGKALETILHDFSTRLDSLLPLPIWMPTPRNLRLKRAIRKLETIIGGLIQERRSTDQAGSDMLSKLIQARDEDDGTGMTDKQLRDEVMTMFLAGHETTANAMAWTWYLLATHPQVEEKLVDEVRTVLNDRPPAVEDMAKLPYMERVIQESMRLYPPIPGIGRKAIEPCTIGDYEIPQGTSFEIMQWVVHRDPRWFEEPEEFRPDRWENDLEKQLPKCAYFPFSTGPRVCVGNRFAMMEATLVLASIATKFRFTLQPDHPVEPFASIALRPANGIKAMLAAR